MTLFFTGILIGFLVYVSWFKLDEWFIKYAERIHKYGKVFAISVFTLVMLVFVIALIQGFKAPEPLRAEPADLQRPVQMDLNSSDTMSQQKFEKFLYDFYLTEEE